MIRFEKDIFIDPNLPCEILTLVFPGKTICVIPIPALYFLTGKLHLEATIYNYDFAVFINTSNIHVWKYLFEYVYVFRIVGSLKFN